jgi:hypothetical protein
MTGLAGGGLIGLGGCATTPLAKAPTPAPYVTPYADRRPPIAPVHARMDRVFDITVCLRPFRAAGPRLDAERVGDALVVHNYGHGGSGWSLSWGSGTMAVRKAMATNPTSGAHAGCLDLGRSREILVTDKGGSVSG